MTRFDELSLQYMAGFTDGEGCISLPSAGSNYYRKGSCKKYYYISPKVVIANTRRDVLQKFKNQFGGYISPGKAANSKWKPVFSYQLEHKRALTFIKAIYPFLVLKRKQAELIFKYYKVSNGRTKRAFTEYRLNRLRSLKMEMHVLNKRGAI